MNEKLLLRNKRMKAIAGAIVVASASYFNPATVFGQTPNITLYADPAMTIQKNVFERGDVVYAKSTNLVLTDYYTHTVSPPVGTGSDQIVQSCTIGVTELPSSFDTDGYPLSYGLSGGASCPGTLAQQQAGQYKYLLKIFADATSCTNGTPTKGGTSGIKTALFRVAQAYAFEDATGRDACLDDATCDANVAESFCPGDNVFMAVRGYIPCNSKVGYQFIRPDGTPVGAVMELGTTATGDLYLPAFAIPSGSAAYLGDWEIKVGPIRTDGGVHSFRTDASNPANTVILDAFNVDVSNTIDARKYYDLNLDGMRQNTEPWLEGWEMTLSGDASGVEYTDANGHAFFTGLPNGNFTVTEGTLPNWIATDGTSKNVAFDEVVCGVEKNRRFGNVCIGGGTDAKSKGFWGNKNGLAIIRATNFCRMNNLCLRTETGTIYSPRTSCPVANPAQTPTANELKAFDQFMQKANSKNALNMLSAQLAAMTLNILHMSVDPSALIYAPGTDAANMLGFASITAVMQESIALLCGDADGKVMAGDADRERALALSDALDRANNNQNFLQSTPCNIDFGQQSPARVAATSATSTKGIGLTTYPNPLTEKTTISYTLTESANVSLVVYDGFGKQIAVLHNGEKAAGQYAAEWNAKDLAAGIYFCRLVINSNKGEQNLQTTKMLLIK